MKKANTTLSVKGRNGYRFLLRDEGQRISIRDYADTDTPRAIRYTGKPKSKKMQEKHDAFFLELLTRLRNGKYIAGDHFVLLCRRHGVWMTKATKMQLQYMNCIDVSIRAIRHKNERGNYERKSFNGVFTSIEKLIAETL